MVDFEVLEIDVDEDEIQDEGPQEYLDRIVKSKVTAAGNKICLLYTSDAADDP